MDTIDLFNIIITFIGAAGVYYLRQTESAIRKMDRDISSLLNENKWINREMVETKEKTNHLDKEISRCRERIHKLEGGTSQLLAVAKELTDRM